MTHTNFWDFLIDIKEPLSRSVYKKAILRGQLALLALMVGFIYIFIDYLNDVFINLPYYGFLILLSVVTIYLNKKSKFQLSNIIYLSLLYALIYVFASSDSYRSGVYTYFIVCNLTALTLCGYEQLRLGLFFVVLSVLLFVIAYVLKLSPVLPHYDFTESYVTISFITNFTVSIITTTALLYFLLGINHHTEGELMENNELLTKTNQELDRFVYSASHDLRAPLSSILGLVEIARKSDNQSEVSMCLNLIEDRIKVQDNFIHEIIEYSRNARLGLVMETIHLKLLIFEIIDQLIYMNDAQQVDIQVEMEEDITINTDKTRLTIVLTNLIANAIKYQDKSKEYRSVKIGAKKSESVVDIFIEDNGAGIPAELQGKIFDMFFRASENSKGSGLGLFIVQETIKRMNGKVSVVSAMGKGSCFTVALPVNQ